MSNIIIDESAIKFKVHIVCNECCDLIRTMEWSLETLLSEAAKGRVDGEGLPVVAFDVCDACLENDEIENRVNQAVAKRKGLLLSLSAVRENIQDEEEMLLSKMVDEGGHYPTKCEECGLKHTCTIREFEECPI